MTDTPRPGQELAGAAIHLPRRATGPLRALTWRLGAALGLVVAVVALVYFDREGYHDNNGGELSVLDAAYYSVVTLSTTGYGDITPVSPGARLVNVAVITPARVLFLIILVGTTLQVLTEQYRTGIRTQRWRRRMKDHVIVCGYGTKGRSAVSALLESGFSAERVVIVERDPRTAAQAISAGLTVIEGSATRADVLRQAKIGTARAIIIAPHSDETAVLVALTARQITKGQVRIVASAREAENAPLLKQSGAHQVVVSASTSGRLLGLSTTAPPLTNVVEDLLTPGEGMALAVRSADHDELGNSPRGLSDVVIAVVRRGALLHLHDPDTERLEPGDLLVYVRDDHTTPQSG